MHVQIVAVGKLKEQYLVQGIEEYKKRMGRYGRLEILEVKEESFTEPLSDKEIQEILRREGERILKELKPRSFVVVLDRGGRALSSEELAEEFQRVALGGTNQLVFVIGGSWGLDEQVLQRADLVLSFSKFTFPHQLMRLILLEQVYRAFTIINKERYHK
ncbi:MAG: 23S rRNA (pseudouridine(1915)-N(3))-methyltransferase RlmH [Limnochordia bacterium]|nr:23S rRNA (pseudouridine(1915)-N(3))-methyltransferase RlmH [Limnochordia bacterium]MDI9464050.1 23S rRNA (pseudouridine(1915)-N(3))-methyltransferase RlmH [Bacillota bacterium]NLO95430.1 23S rRNA (pseudouridine(1915)-N(3))-methyltransferase RlmH [Bacillota bacterium]HOB41273.1 23S rRNA (pseudouridine(1915)-N(3))-methyltransferase RlmH [Limnochordia bacterium]HOK31576.1 23S rRNA (pseudouridine(1915)-N(3))-methyltransferase RlmH [Limnochordia bacterium]